MAFTIHVDAQAVLANIVNLRRGFREAVAEVQPVFGAFMPYSIYAERGNDRYPPQPAVEPAISRNAQWITSEVTDRLMPALDRAMRSGGIASLKSEVEFIWESVLNDRPRMEAAAMARVRTGAHRASIAGYATAQGVEAALRQGEFIASTQRTLARKR